MTEKLVLKNARLNYINVGTGTLHIHDTTRANLMCGMLTHTGATIHPTRRVSPGAVCRSCYRVGRAYDGFLAIEREEVAG